MRTYASSRVKRKSFYRKKCTPDASVDISALHQNGTPIWRPHYRKLYKSVRNVSANNSQTVGHKDLRLRQIVYIQ